MDNALIEQGFELMLFGMGMVFVFLALLILATTLMSVMLQHFAPADQDAQAAASGTGPDSKLIAVITAAIHKHRSRDW